MNKLVAVITLSLVFFNFIKELNTGIPQYIYPSNMLLVAISVPIYLSLKLVNYLNKIIVFFWITFFYVGSINIINSFNRNINYDLKVEESGWIFIIFLTFFILGILVTEKLISSPKNKILIPLNDNIIFKILLFFPFIWFFSVLYSVGFLPILAGIDITSNMYLLNYGPLHGFQIVIVFSILSVFEKYLFKNNNIYYKIFHLILILSFLFILMFDGRRYIILIGLTSLYILYILRKNEFFLSKRIFFSLLAIMFFYILLLLLRTGTSKTEDIAAYLSSVFPFGDEYRDFVYSVNHFKPGRIKGYDFLGSTLGSIMNTQILKLFDFDKQKLVESGSAHVWMKLYDINFGIRTGIISELYFAFDYWGLVFIFILGALLAFLVKKILNAKLVISQYSLIIMYSLLMYAIMGQFTSIIGPFTTIFYVWILNKFFSKISNFNK